MKKFIFSAVAMVAFVGSSMASNEVLSKVAMKDGVNLLPQVSGCASVYLDTYQAAVDNGADNQQASRTAWRAYNSCIQNTVPIIE